MAILDVRNLSVTYHTRQSAVRAVDNVSFSLDPGESLGLVGESGSGKTTIGKAILRILPPGSIEPESEVFFEGCDLLALSDQEMQAVRGKRIGLIPQSAMNALDPVVRIGKLIVEAMSLHGAPDRRAAEARIEELFTTVGLNIDRLSHYPHMFSGGMRQRAAVAMAFSLGPSFIIADEPTTGLDVIVQNQVLKELARLLQQQGASYIIITHDIGVVSEQCRLVAVLYAGRLVEIGPVSDVLTRPTHPYTMGLRNGFLGLRGAFKEIISIPGAPPTLEAPHPGCPFCDRCPFAEERCETEVPPLSDSGPAQRSACHFRDRASQLLPLAERVETWEKG